MIKPAKKRNLYEEISSQIIKMIYEGNWKPGDKIPGEVELSKSFEVSRNSIRESIKALELVGILESKTGIGTFVSEQAMININNMHLASLIESKSSILELMEARLIIEPGLAYLATKHATEEDIKALEEIIIKHDNALKNKNYTFDMGFEFHRYLFKMANNKILNNLLDSITENLIATRGELYLKHLNEHILEYELSEHKEILAYIKNKDAISAQNTMWEHIESSLCVLEESMKEVE
ncbi:FadR family transcriptional regulator [Crassaminicella thermophila]|uniref:FadR family transcriptional regulator n=1 Tax=Crassaminicella thermophila TaxID=2599308 RepID=A0A5C0SA93_CRATE|nr:FadR/GntR family transcriptional regulator [Crassaminicella thermophila]QEK11493.1 FadR family transcriptional regulator [Crassaminicella thermophila]